MRQNSLVSSEQAIYGVAYDAMRDISSASTEKKGILNDLLFQYLLRRQTEYYVRAASAIEPCEEERRFGAPIEIGKQLMTSTLAAHNNNNLSEDREQLKGMWHSEDFMIADEVVADGAQCHRRLNSDSGFLSGVNINEDSAVITSSSINLSDEQDSMKLKSAAQFSVNEINLDYKSGKINNLSSPVKPQKELPRRITLRDLLRQDEDGDTPLHLAVLQGFIEVVFSLVRILPDPRLLEIPNKYLQTPLHLAVLTNQAPLVRRLVVGGASVLLRDRLGNTPLHLACRDGHVDCAHALLLPVSHEERQSALLPLHIVPQPLPQDLEQKNYDGQMPLHLAAMNGHVSIAKLLCCFGANVNAMEGKYGRTALHYSVERRHPAMLHFLVSQCGAQTEAETYSGYTAHQIASVSEPVLAALLADLGAQIRPCPLEKFSSDEEDFSDSKMSLTASWRPRSDKV
ncbi:developmental protein cactus [Daphnia pulex]|uniref:Developmental protein cactus n=1 Tax=Daphnia pulex TaxID=6669 RepID=E9FSH5_DAPPU|nr:developmental protein cactus [Daphnia pulex]|eukprot:EFX89207.1 developmental protein cactus [Daphnia pulex]